MEILKFLAVDSGYGSGYGDGYGYGNGDGYGYGYGDGDGYGNGDGYGDGDGYGYGYGYGYGNGDGYGDGDGNGNGDGNGYGNGDGYGDGYGYKISKYKNAEIFYIDNIPCVFLAILGNVAKVNIISTTDFTLKPAYLIKDPENGIFAHGETIKKAREALIGKRLANMNIDERLAEFHKVFNNTDSYPAQMFFDWHHNLTGSCEFGRKEFVKNHNVDMNRKFTVKEFIALCENDYGGEIIKKLK